jgi:hypothetical protein
MTKKAEKATKKGRPRPKLKKEKLRDLDPRPTESADVKAGYVGTACTRQDTHCSI